MHLHRKVAGALLFFSAATQGGLAYSTALATMFATTARLDPQLSTRGRKTVQAGAALFLLSDTLLGVREFVLRRESPALERAVMATYTAGQGLIAAGSAHLATQATQP